MLIAENIEDLQELVNRVGTHSKLMGLNMNIAKTKFMVVSRDQNIGRDAVLTFNDLPIEKVQKFKYLGTWLTEDWTSETEIKCRIEHARSSFIKYKQVFTSTEFDLNLKIRLIKCYVWSVLLYGMEGWTLKITSMNKIEAFEMWLYRRVLKISWTERITNEEVLRRVGKERELLTTNKRRKVAYLGHIMRNQKYDILQLIIEGKIEGKRGIGRKKMSWLRNIRQWTGLNTIGSLVHTFRNREETDHIVANIH